jgi:uncharacterized RDD family membrane protein YckC
VKVNLPAPHDWTGAASSPALASYGRRFMGWLVDVLIFAGPAILVLLATIDLDSADPVASIPFYASVLFSVAFIIYQTAMVAWRGQTVGAMSMSIMIVRIDTHEKPGWASSGIRALVPQVAGLVPYIGPLLMLVVHGWMFVDRNRQGLQDKAAGTIVVSATA